jgi:hypothetical protein
VSVSPGLIYGLVDPDTLELRYVGLTRVPTELRLRQHLNAAACCVKTHVYDWIRSLSCAPSLVVLERDPLDGLEAAEQRWIAEMRLSGARLTNMTDGGDGQSPGYSPTAETCTKVSAAKRGCFNGPLSPEHRAKLSAALMGNQCAAGHTCSPETRAKISAAQMGHAVSPETCAKLSAAHMGHTLSLEHRAKIGAAQMGHAVSPETRAKMSAAQKGRVRGLLSVFLGGAL